MEQQQNIDQQIEQLQLQDICLYDPNKQYLLQKQNLITINDLERKICKNNVKIRTLLGNPGSGKSSILKRITNSQEISVSNDQHSHTQECSIYEKNGIPYIDTPGLNDTIRGRYSILLQIVRYLFSKEYKLDQIFFVYVSSKELQTQHKDIIELVYTYFLYEQFKEQIDETIIQKLIDEFLNSNYFLKWFECKYHIHQDMYSAFRVEIYRQKDKALNYIQYANSYHIFVQTHFDKEEPEDLEDFNQYAMDSFKKQVWSNIADSHLQDLKEYQQYIQDQEKHLNIKILKIIHVAQQYYENYDKKETQNIIILGESQVGKSSRIEQLTKIRGLRGNGRQSETRQCEIYTIEYKNVKYNLIDTPGIGGTESRISCLDNLKIIADFLRRNKILEFKLLFVRNADKDHRNNFNQIIKEFLIFITELFDQEVTQVDSDMLKDILKSDFNNEVTAKNIKYVKDRMIFLERVTSIANSPKEIYYNKFQIKSIEFLCDYLTRKGDFKQIEEEQDVRQKDLLFSAINSIDTLSLQDKIQLKITEISHFQILTNPNKYLEYYEQIFLYYLELKDIIDKIDSQQNSQNELDNLITKKIDLYKKLNCLDFGLAINFNKIKDVQDHIQHLFDNNSDRISQNTNEHQEYIQQQINMFRNNIQRHFLILYQWNSYQFQDQSQDSQSQNILFSRKQLYFWNLSYHLQDVIDLKEKKKILEELAQLKVVKEIITYKHIQNVLIDAFLYENQEKLNTTIQEFFEAMDKIIGVGGEGFRNMTYFSYNAKLLISSFKAIKEVNKILLALNIVASLASIGFDYSSYQQRIICSQQMQLNTVSNVLSGFLGIAAFLIPGIGWVIGGIAAAIGLIGNLISQFKYTNKNQFDETIGLFFKNFLNESNVKLMYFQKADFLKKQFCIQMYSQPQSNQAYDCYRQLYVDNFENNKDILQKIHQGQSEQSNNLKDNISQYIVKEIIMNKLIYKFDDIQQENCNQFIKQIQEWMKQNNLILETFFNHYYIDENKLLNKINKNNCIKDNIQKVLSTNNPSNELLDLLNQQIKDYSFNFNLCIDQIKSKNFKYEDCVEFGNGNLRKGDNFKILFDSYCNLTVQKQKYLCEQNLISEIKLSQTKDLFEINQEFKNKNFFLIEEKIEVILDQISLLTNFEAFISSRYLQKYKGREELNLSYCSQENNIETNLEKSTDLLQLLKNNEPIKEEQFFDNVLKQFPQIQNDALVKTRIQSFYRAYCTLNLCFKNDQSFDDQDQLTNQLQ
ncbi:hypothetical protein ABPG74_018999 [Tetrahymena malaccensis]